MNIFRKIKQFFKPEYHFFMLKNGEELELRVYRNGIRVSQKELMTTKKGSKVLADYLAEQKAKEMHLGFSCQKLWHACHKKRKLTLAVEVLFKRTIKPSVTSHDRPIHPRPSTDSVQRNPNQKSPF